MLPVEKMTPMELLRSKMDCTYELQRIIAQAGGPRYVLKRSDGRLVNLDRAAYLRLERGGKLEGGGR